MNLFKSAQNFFSYLILSLLVLYFVLPGFYKIYPYSISLVCMIIFLFQYSSVCKKTVLPVMSLFIFVLFADLINMMHGSAVLSDFEKILRNIVLIFPFLLFLSHSSLQAKEILWAGTCLFLVTLFFMTLQKYGLYAQNASHYDHQHPGLWFNKGSFSTAIVLFFALFAGFAVQVNDKIVKWLLLIATLSMFAILYLTQARGPLLAFIYVLIFCSVYILSMYGYTRNKIFFLAFTVIFIISLAAYLIAGSRISFAWQQLVEHFSEGSSPTSVSIRIDTWKLAWDVFLHNPIVGVGANNINSVKEYIVDTGDYPPYILKYHTHSEYFLTLERGGVVGLIGLFWMMFYPFFSLKKFGVDFKKMSPLFLVVGSFMIIGITSATIRNNIGANSFIFCLLSAYFISYKYYRREFK